MVKKTEFIWNMLGSFVYAMFSAIILAICTRANDLEIAGIFSIAYATSCVLNAIGDFGIRIYQVTDTNKKYTFSEYFSARIIAIAIMLLISIAFVIISGYNSTKLVICLILVLYRVIDNLSETFQAEFQINERLDIAGKSMVFRNSIAIILFAIIDIITHNIVISSICMVIANLIVFILYDTRILKRFNKDQIKFKIENAKIIVRECFPMAIASVLNVYVINAVKYAIDATGDNTMQTYFNIIYMPTFVINLISIFIIKPFLKAFGDYWNGGEHKKLFSAIGKIIASLVGVTLVIEIGCYILGIPVLGWFYGVDISIYKLELMILIISGLLYAICNLLFNMLGTIRKQNYISAVYIITSLIALIIPKALVNKYQMTGAVVSNLLIMLILCVLLAVFLVIGIKQQKNIERKNEK